MRILLEKIVFKKKTTYITSIKDSGIFPSSFWKDVALVTQQPMHISYEAQVVLVSRSLTYGGPPFFYQDKYLSLNTRRVYWRPFRKPTDELIQEFLCRYLQVKRIATVL